MSLYNIYDYVHKQLMRCQRVDKTPPNVSNNRLSRDSGFVNSSDFTSSDLELFVDSIEAIAKIERRKSLRGSYMSNKWDDRAVSPMTEDSGDELNWHDIRTSTPYSELMRQAQQIDDESNLEENGLSGQQTPLEVENAQENVAFCMEDTNARTDNKPERMSLRKRIVSWLRREEKPKRKENQDDHLSNDTSELSYASAENEPKEEEVSLSRRLKRSFYGIFSLKRNKSVRRRTMRNKRTK